MDDTRTLRSKATEETFVFAVDSQQRDRNAWPTPSEYAIEFDRPFQHVIGFELLHAVVPRTEYTIDADRNRLVYKTEEDDTTKTLSIEPGDYNLVQLCEEMNAGLQGIFCEPHSAPYQVRSRIRFASQTPFVILTPDSTIARVLGFYETVPFQSSMIGLDTARTFQGPFPGLDYEPLEQDTTVLRQTFAPEISGILKKLVVHCTAGSVLQCRVLDGSDNELGAGTVDGSESPEVEVSDGLHVVRGAEYTLEITASSEAGGVYRGVASDGGSPALKQTTTTDEEDAEEDAVAWEPLESGDALAIEVFVDVERHEVSGPGLVDLTGERLVFVRCQEIESRFHRSRRSERFHAGLGMVRMGVNGFAENRFETFPPRRLADPIGKLKTLTFRLEKVDGTVYNARGVDHCLVCSIKYLVMDAFDQTPSILNPQYTPDVTQHMVQKWRDELDERERLRLQKQEEARDQQRVMDTRYSSFLESSRARRSS